METLSLTELSNQWRVHKENKKIKIGIRVGFSPINHHLLILLNRLKKHATIEGLAFTKKKEYERKKVWYQREFSEETLITYENNENHLLNYFDMVLLPESNFEVYEEYPKGLIKIGLPHGIDIPFQKTVIGYGGGLMFDYVLSPTQETLNAQLDKFENLYHKELRNHKRDYICQIPFGFPKLDDFIDATTKAQQNGLDSIAYHIAILSIEEKQSIQIIQSTLQILLDNFPNKRIIFRPYKYDLENKIIKDCIRLGETYGNFHLSTEESYIQDYSTSVAMVCHRAYKAHLFSLATGSPIILCHPDNHPTIALDPSVVVCSQKNLINQLQSVIDYTPPSLNQRIDLCSKHGIYNPGNSVEYLVKNIEYILKDRPHPDWNYYSLDSKNLSLDLRTYTALQLISAKPANIAFNSIVSRHPLKHEALLFLADSYSRKNELVDYYSKLSLKCFYKLITTQGLSYPLKTAAESWWVDKGQNLLQQAYGNNLSTPPKSISPSDYVEEDFLPNLLLATKNIKIVEKQENTKQEILIDLQTLKPAMHYDTLALYGARNLANQLIKSLRNTADIKLITDPDPLIIGTKIGKLTVQHPDALRTCNDPILICSFNYLLESFIDLRKKLGPDRKLYAVCKDQQILDFLKLI